MNVSESQCFARRKQQQQNNNLENTIHVAFNFDVPKRIVQGDTQMRAELEKIQTFVYVTTCSYCRLHILWMQSFFEIKAQER